jgi:4-hydroxybenzoate polyprenyltransferase
MKRTTTSRNVETARTDTALFLLRVSRPRFWLYLAGPFLIGSVFAVSDVNALATLSFALWLVFFLLPANLFLYGINDRYDEDTDQFNAKKGAREHLLRVKERRLLAPALVMTLVLYAIALVTLVMSGENVLALLLLALLALSAGYSVPPVRFKSRPVLDMLSNALYLVPGFFGYALYAHALPSWGVTFALVCWTCAMQLYSAIPDIAADAKARLRTTAVVLGESRSLLLCAALWLVFFSILAATGGSGWGLGWLLAPLALYVALPLIPLVVPLVARTVRRSVLVERLYWYYPWFTGLLGFLFWWVFALEKGGFARLERLFG